MKTITGALFVFLFLGVGCVVVGEPGPGHNIPPPQPGDVTMTWSFAGLNCSQVPQVRSVRVSIPGETLLNDGVYPCTVNRYPGIVLHDFLPGSYSYAVEAQGYSDEGLYMAAGTFFVNGDTRVSIDLTPTGSPSSYAYLAWQFPPNASSSSPDCALAGVSRVEVIIDQDLRTVFDCDEGFRAPGAKSPFLLPGLHSIEIGAMDETGYRYYSYSGELETFGGAPVAAEYQLQWAVGGTAVTWRLANGFSCSQAGLQTMYINFQDSYGNLVYGQYGDPQSCDSAPIVYDFLQPGRYRVFIQGEGPTGIRYLSDAQSAPVVSVVAGRFVGSAGATLVPLFRVQ